MSFWAVFIILDGSSRYASAKCPTRMGSIFVQDHFLVIARGSSQFPENTIPAFQKALNVDGANALEVDLSLTKDIKIVLWRDWDPNHPAALIRQEKGEKDQKFKPFGPSTDSLRGRKKISGLTLAEFIGHYGYVDKITHAKTDAPIPTFKDLIVWANQQNKLKLVLLKLMIPADEKHLSPIMLEEIKRIIGDTNPQFKFVITTHHKEILNQVKNQFGEFLFSFDREILPAEVTNYHSFTTIPIAMSFKNSFAGIGLPFHSAPSSSPALDPWLTYKYILTMDFKLRDNYKKGTKKYIKIISWNFNDEKKIRCLINLGVDGIVTNKPKLLRRIALEMGKILD